MMDIYKMKLHEVAEIVAEKGGSMLPFTNVFRVPGGWIYCSWDGGLGDYTNRVFVPFINDVEITGTVKEIDIEEDLPW